MKKTLWAFSLLIVVATIWAVFRPFGQDTPVPQAAKHPVDRMFSNRNSIEFRSARVMDVIIRDDVLEKMAATESQKIQITSVKSEFDKKSSEIWKEWRAQNPSKKSFQPFAPPTSKKLVIETVDKMRELFDSRQLTILYQEELQSYGTDVLMLDEVRQNLGLSEKQILSFKNWHLDRIVNRNEFIRKWQAADLEDRPTMEAEFQKQTEAADPLAKILTSQQQTKLNEILGLKPALKD